MLPCNYFLKYLGTHYTIFFLIVLSHFLVEYQLLIVKLLKIQVQKVIDHKIPSLILQFLPLSQYIYLIFHTKFV